MSALKLIAPEPTPRHMTKLEWRGFEIVACEYFGMQSACGRLLKALIRSNKPLSRLEVAKAIAPAWLTSAYKGGSTGVRFSELRRALRVAGFPEAIYPEPAGWWMPRDVACAIQNLIDSYAETLA